MYCKYCNEDKPEADFEVALTTSTKTYRRLKCKRCKQDTQNLRIRKTVLWIQSLKKSCTKCGNTDPRVLDFHHIGSKDMDVSSMRTLSKERILEEIKQCIVLCANCHRIEHSESSSTR